MSLIRQRQQIGKHEIPKELTTYGNPYSYRGIEPYSDPPPAIIMGDGISYILLGDDLSTILLG